MIIAPLLVVLALHVAAAAETVAAPAAVPAAPAERLEDTWDLSSVFPSVDAWEKEMTRVETEADGLESCRGKLAVDLRGCVERRFVTQEAVSRLGVYATNISAADTRSGEWRGRAQRAEMLFTHLGERSAFYEPEIVALGGAAVDKAIGADPKLAPYDHYLRSTVAHAAHTLDPQREALLAATGTLLAAPERAHTVLIDAELPWPSITLASGTVQLTPANYTVERASSTRADRKSVFEAFFGALKGFQGVLGTDLDTVTQGHWLVAQTRGYESSVAAAIDTDHLPPAVYRTLVDTTNKNLPTLHRYLRLRARMLGVNDLAYYDMYPPLVNLEKSWTIDEAKSLALASMKPLGPAYTSVLEKGFTSRWMDANPRPGKKSGAYMDGAAYAVHPFLLLNYGGDYESVSTLAHEWGHAVHTALSAQAQPYAKADYSTFIAEIASTFAEDMLLEHMLEATKSDDERLFYLGNALEGLRTTYFRQAQFAEFELAIHEQVEKGEPLTGESLSTTYLDILKRYYGAKDGVTRIDDLYGVEWAYIPHFYYNFYVYQYATSIAASSLFAEDVLAKKPGAVDRYLTLLRAGGSDDPYVLLKTAGVDMATPAPYDALARRMDKIMDEIEAILAKREGKKPGKKGK
jgi:oligoendopeptidase F